jgi:type II secretion system protein D
MRKTHIPFAAAAFLWASTAALEAQQPPPAVLPPGAPVTAQVPPPQPTPQQVENVSITFPNNPVADVLNFYETLTNKRIIRDSNLAGQNLSIIIAKPVSREDAISIIETSLLMNNYSIVPVDGDTIKVLGPSRAPRTEGLPLFSAAEELPTDGDKVVSFYKPLAFITPEEAMTVIQGVVQVNPYGTLVPVPNTNAIIITDKTPIIRRALGILELIDIEPARVVTEFVQLERANAERIVEILDEMFDTGDAAKSGSSAQAPPQGQPQQGQPPQGGAPNGGQPAAPTGGGARYENRLIAGKANFLADKRTNRILVVTRTENYRFVRDIIEQLDAAAEFEQPYVRPLKYVPMNDIFTVLGEMLADPESETQGGTGSNQGSSNSNPFANTGNTGGSSLGGTGGSSGGINAPDRLADEAQQGTPQAITIGEIRVIGDSNSNSIIVYGPPEAKLRAKQILDLLDQRPKQVYLAVVIGQLRLKKGVDYGVNYLLRTEGFKPLQNALGNSAGSGLAASSLAPNLLPGGVFPNPAALVNPDAFNKVGLGSLAGLTLYGTIADSVDIYARFLEATGRFRTLARPVVYTTNNRKATILSGEKVPVPTQSLTAATGGGISANGSSITSNIQYQDVVLKLEVIPLINSDGEVNLVIAQTNDNINGFDNVSGNQVPRIATQEITTSVRVPNGSTIVLGGLIKEDKELGREGMPYISEIPVLGSLLGGRTQNKIEKRELIVMIQPIVSDSNEDMMKASAYEADRSPLGRDGQEMTAPIAEQHRPPAVWTPTPLPPETKKKFRWPWSNDQFD